MKKKFIPQSHFTVKMPPKAEKKICMVPACEASSTDYPDRIFVSVPENKKREWLAMVGAESVYIHPTKRFFCCEEHFDVSAIQLTGWE